MVANLRHVNEAALTQIPPDFAVEEVRDESTLEAIKGVLIEGLEVPDWAARAWVDAALRIGVDRTPWRMYLGRLGGAPVATIPPARRRGVGGAITLKSQLDARDEGYRHAVLFASEMAVRAYERVGFRDCGVRLNRYLWPNA